MHYYSYFLSFAVFDSGQFIFDFIYSQRKKSQLVRPGDHRLNNC